MRGSLWLAAAFAAVAILARPEAVLAQQSQCRLGNGIKHVVYIQFDNVHFRRDIPKVPSDLEQIPNLLNFLEDNGSFLTNHWTPLISHTSVDIVTALTGVYGDKFGFSIGNSFGGAGDSIGAGFSPRISNAVSRTSLSTARSSYRSPEAKPGQWNAL